MKRLLVCVLAGCLLALLMPGVAESQCGPNGCPGGVCPTQEEWQAPIQPRRPIAKAVKAAAKVATPVRRYGAVCRIHVDDGNGVTSKGSGVLIYRGGKFIVLTAWHVIKDRRGAIHVRFGTGPYRWHQANVLTEDAKWDCAALEVSQPDGIEPAELADGAEATPKPGDTVETCGFGSDDTLQPTSGQCLGYGAPEKGAMITDWLGVSGTSRDGDSGGPMFNPAGKVVGVFWGSNDGNTWGAQGARLHLMLEEVTQTGLREKIKERMLGGAAKKMLPPLPQMTRPERAPLMPLVPIRREPPRPEPQQQVIVNTDPAVIPAIDRAGDTLVQIEANTRPPVTPEKPAEMSPLLAGLVVLGSVVLGFIFFFKTQEG